MGSAVAFRLNVRWTLFFAALLGLATGSCGGEEAPALQVFAASSLEPVLTEWSAALEEEMGMPLSMSFGASNVVARQVVEGAPADVVITADRRTMQVAADAGVVGERTVVARNRLALVVGRGNPERIGSLRDLGRPGLKVVLCDSAVPCGRLAAQLLDRSGVPLRPASLEENIGAAVGKVAFGEADATIGYGSDVRSGAGRVEEVEMPGADSADFTAVYPAAVVKGTPQRAAAQRLIRVLASTDGQRVFARAGFLPAKLEDR